MIKSFEPSMIGVKHPVSELVPLCKKNGFEAIGAPAILFEDEKAALELNAIVKDSGLQWGLLPMPADFYFWDLSDEDFEKGLKELERRAVIAERLGITHAYNHVWSSGTREFEENFQWHVDRVRKVSHILSEHGVHYGLEFLGPHELRTFAPHPFVHSLSGVLAIADAAGGETGIALDAHHWFCSHNGDPGDILWLRTHIDRLVAFHMNDAVEGIPFDKQQDMVRRLPMDNGTVNTRWIYSQLDVPGNTALCMIEPFQPASEYFGTLSPEEAMKRAGEALRKVVK